MRMIISKTTNFDKACNHGKDVDIKLIFRHSEMPITISTNKASTTIYLSMLNHDAKLLTKLIEQVTLQD